MKKFMIIALLFSFIPFFPSNTFALSCEQPGSIKESFKNYDGVIIGEVIHIKERFGKKVVTVDVSKSYKGIEKNVITMKESKDWGESKVGTEYLFFLNKKGLKWENPLCAPMTKVSTETRESLKPFKEIKLKNVKKSESETKKTIVMVALMSLTFICLSLFLLHQKKKKSN